MRVFIQKLLERLSLCRTSAAIVGLLYLISFAHGQDLPDRMPKRGIVPAGTYAVSEVESINVATGNITYRIPLASLPSGHAGFGAGINLIYNSQIYDYSLDYVDVNGYTYLNRYLIGSEYGGWRYGFQYSMNLETRFGNCLDDWGTKMNKLVLVSPDGSPHTLHLYRHTARATGSNPFYDANGDGYYEVKPSGASDCPTVTPATGDLTYHTTDGSYMKVVFSGSNSDWTQRPWTIYLSDGTSIHGKNTTTDEIRDKNGNVITITRTFDGGSIPHVISTTLSDDLGHSISLTHDPDAGTSTVDTITQTGYSEGDTPRTLTWTVNRGTVDLAGSALRYVYDNVGSTLPAGAKHNVITSIVLPTPSDNSTLSYSFEYADNSTSGWGELNDVVFPSGAHVHYQYMFDNSERTGDTLKNPLLSKTLTWLDQHEAVSRTDTTTYHYSEYGPSTRPYYSEITGPDGGKTFNYYEDSVYGFKDVVYKTVNPDGSTVERVWSQNRPYGATTTFTTNPYVEHEIRSVASSTGVPTKMNARSVTIDKNGNETRVLEYDWVSYPPTAPALPSGLLPAFNGQDPVRTTAKTYVNITAAASHTGDANGAYWNPLSPAIRNLVNLATTTGTGIGSTQSFSYGDSHGHPNLVAQSVHDSQTGQNRTTSYTYDSHGNVATITNPKSVVTTNTYNSSSCLTGVTISRNATTLRSASYTCDPNMLLVTQEKDEDHDITKSYDYDRFGRNTKIDQSGGGLERRTVIAYADGARTITDAKDLNTLGDGALTTVTHFDQLGRVWKAQDIANNIVKSRILTAGNANYELVSNPHVSGSESTMGWIRTKRDQSGRIVEVRHFSGNTQPEPWVASSNAPTTGAVTYAYDAEFTTIKDEADVQRVQEMDGLGRLKSLTESGLLVSGVPAKTAYTYDVLDKLTTVTQGAQTRNFSYSSLGLLVEANNPESGLISYGYDPNGNVKTRVHAGVVTSYCYDDLDQLTAKAYGSVFQADCDAPAVTYAYNKGWRTLATGGGSATANALFDGFGRVKELKQTTDGTDFLIKYNYNLADGITQVTYPSGRIVDAEYDSVGRLASVKDQAKTGYYAQGLTYTPHGALATMTLGNGLVESASYNARLQMTGLQAGSLLSLQYGYSATQNNGNVQSQTIQVGGNTYSQTYTYDGVNRLLTASEEKSSQVTWSQSFGYDRWGNRWVSAATPPGLSDSFTPTSSSNFDADNNRLLVNGATYDGAGNQAGIGGHSFTYDGENRVLTSTLGSGVTTYAYDADGHRVKKSGPNGTTVYVYDLGGALISEYGTQESELEGTRYVTSDMLGSTRLITKSDGSVATCNDYHPFGGEIDAALGSRPACYSAEDDIAQKFTGKERDRETNLDYFGARYFSAVQGRFSTPDAPFADQKVADPQSWNLYGYVRNRPTVFVDLDGREPALFPTFDDGRMLLPGPYGDRIVRDNRTLSQKLKGDAVLAGVIGVAIFAPELVPALLTWGRNATGACYLSSGCQTQASEALKSFFGDDSPGLAPPVGKVTTLALGIESYGLKAFAVKNGYTYLSSYGDNWRTFFFNLMSNESTTIVFRLDGVDSAWGSIAKAAQGQGGATDWELLQIYQNPLWWNRITWVLNGEVVSNPFQGR